MKIDSEDQKKNYKLQHQLTLTRCLEDYVVNLTLKFQKKKI